MKAFSVVATRRKKILLHLLAFIAGVSGAVFLPLDNKDIIGWLVGSFTAFGGLLLALMTLAGHSLTLLQGEDWKALQFFKSTFKSRIFSSALLRWCSHEIEAHKKIHLICMAARNDVEFFAYLVAIPRHCFK